MLYIFSGFPGKGAGPDSQHLHAGGLQYAIETVENLAIVEHDPAVQYRKEGVFTNETEEMLYPIEHQISNALLDEGITWDWFTEGWRFGNGVTTHKTMASPTIKQVIHGTNLTIDDFLNLYGPTKVSELTLERKHIRHESWESYEARWLPGTCPQENHAVHLTWLVTTHKLPEFIYERIRDLVERGAEPKDLHHYSEESGKHFHTARTHSGG